MSIIRVKHNKENPYVMISKEVLEDGCISWQAKGLLAYLIGRPDNWNICVAHLKTIYKGFGGGRDSIYRILKELIKTGYCEKIQEKENGKYSKVEYLIYEFKKCLPTRETPVPEFAVPQSPDYNNNRVKQSNERTNKDNVKEHVVEETLSSFSRKPKTLANEEKPLKAKGNEWKFSQNQQETYLWLQGCGIDTTDGTIAHWVKTYQPERIKEVFEYAKKNSPKSMGAYMNQILKKQAIVENEVSRTNKKSAQSFKKESNWSSMEVLERYIKITLTSGSTEEVPYNLDPMDFFRKMVSLRELS